MKDTKTELTKEELEKVRIICQVFKAQKVWIVPKNSNMDFIRKNVDKKTLL